MLADRADVLAMAVDEHGADYWANQELFAVGARVDGVGRQPVATVQQAALHGLEERLTTDIYPADFGWTPDWRLRQERIDWWYHNLGSVTGAGRFVAGAYGDLPAEAFHVGLECVAAAGHRCERANVGFRRAGRRPALRGQPIRRHHHPSRRA